MARTPLGGCERVVSAALLLYRDRSNCFSISEPSSPEANGAAAGPGACPGGVGSAAPLDSFARARLGRAGLQGFAARQRLAQPKPVVLTVTGRPSILRLWKFLLIHRLALPLGTALWRGSFLGSRRNSTK
jgi:hypothetical protein